MKRILTAIALYSLATAGACQRENETTDKRLDALLDKLDGIEKKLNSPDQRRVGGPTAAGGPGGPAAAGQPQQRPRPNPADTYAIPIGAKDAYRGGQHAKVTIVEAFEFACPHCSTMGRLSAELLKKYKAEDLRVVSKHYVVHPQIATLPAQAACAADRQGKYAAYEHELWERAWPVSEGKPSFVQQQLAPDSLKKIAADLGLDPAKFDADMNGAECKELVMQNQREMQAFGVQGTPTVFVNGKIYQGGRSVEAFSAVIDAEIAKADAAIKSGVRLEDYYAATILKTGKKTL